MIENLYLNAFLTSLGIVLLMTPVMRWFAVQFNILDRPSTPVKTHVMATPYLGGVAIFAGIAVTLLLTRVLTHFPTGTLRSLRGILIGITFMLAVGLVDDIKNRGLNFKWKFLFQFIGALLLIAFDIRIKFIHPVWLAYVVTIIWVVGVTNAFNIIDIMDGLASSQAFIACAAFLLISIPSEEIYVNFAASAVAGACLGFFPYNMSGRLKIFMGDAGSLTLGFLLSALSLGTSYSRVSEIGVLAPILILGLPLYDTFFVSFMRLSQGKSPFLGSKDHLALKLRALGFNGRQVVAVLAASAIVFSLTAYFVTWCSIATWIIIVGVLLVGGLFVVRWLQKVHVQ